MIPKEFVQNVLEKISISDVIGQHVKLKRSGANFVGLCPFHNEKTPSFSVSSEKQIYHCFGCGAHGTAVNFLIEYNKINFPEAVQSLASSVGLVFPKHIDGLQKKTENILDERNVSSRHIQVLESAHGIYTHWLKSSSRALKYLEDREISKDSIRRFGLGWAGTAPHNLTSALPQYQSSELVKAGLTIQSSNGCIYDRFCARIIFPIRNRKGVLIGFGGRTIANGTPKYLNSPETCSFSKRQELYGLWEAQHAIQEEGKVIVVEGYLDVISLAQRGIANVVAALGTATTVDQIKKLLRCSKKIIFCFDGDSPGLTAAKRVLTAILPLLSDDVTIRFLFLPDNHDPDSYVRTLGIEEFRSALNKAKFLSHILIQELVSHHQLDEPEGKANCLHEAKSIISIMPDCALRIQIKRELARKLEFNHEEIERFLVERPLNYKGFSQIQKCRLHRSSELSPPRLPDLKKEKASLSSFAYLLPHAKIKKSYNSDHKNSKIVDQKVSPDLAKKLICLLISHPELVDNVGDQQLEILENDLRTRPVKDFVLLLKRSGERCIDTLIKTTEIDSSLMHVLQEISAEPLPEPQAEWDDALCLIELNTLKEEMGHLASIGLSDAFILKRYQDLHSRALVLYRKRNKEF